MAAYLNWRRPAQHPGEQTDPATAKQEELPPPPDPRERTQQATLGRRPSSGMPQNQQPELPTSKDTRYLSSVSQSKIRHFPAPLWLDVVAVGVCQNKLVYLIMNEAKEQAFYSLLHLMGPEQVTYLSRVWEKYFSVFAMSVPEGTG